MCFFKNQSEIIANENINCYKVLFKSRDSGKISSPVRGVPYFDVDGASRVRKQAKFDVNHSTLSVLHQGLHSYSSYDRAKTTVADFFIQYLIYEAYIPKGTRYYHNNKREEYISEKLVVRNKLVV